MSTIKLYRHPVSGHSHRAEVLLSLLGIDADIIDVDLMSGAQKEAVFTRKNIFAQVPVLEDGNTIIADSNAILVYLATKYDPIRNWLPTDSLGAAEVQRFLTVASGLVAYGPAAARLVNLFNADIDHQRAINTAHGLLTVLEKHLENRQWLVGERATIADVANYAYIAHAPEGDVSLDAYPNVRNWLKRFEQLPGFIPMTANAIGLVA